MLGGVIRKRNKYFKIVQNNNYHNCQIYIQSFVQIILITEEMQKKVSVDKRTANNHPEIWTLAKDLQRIINSHQVKSKQEGAESSIDETQEILTISYKIIDNLQGKIDKESVKKVSGTTKSKDEGYKEQYSFARIKQITAILDQLKKETNVEDEKSIIKKVKDMSQQIEAYRKFIDFILEYPKDKTFIVQKKIPAQQQEKIKKINNIYIQLTTKIKELQPYRNKSKIKSDKDGKDTLQTLLIMPISQLLKQKAEEKARNDYLNTVLNNIITANFKPIQSKKYGLDPTFTEHLNKLNTQFENVLIISSEILEKVKESIDKYSRPNKLKNNKKIGLVNLQEIKSKIGEMCQFLDKLYSLSIIKQKYGAGEFSHLSDVYKTRLDIYAEILRKNEKFQQESIQKSIDSERQRFFEFVSELCRVISRKENRFIVKEIFPSNLNQLVNEIKSMKSQVQNYDTLTRQVIQKDQMINNLQNMISKAKSKYLTKQVMQETGIVSHFLLNNKNFIQSPKIQEKSQINKCEKCDELFVENSGLIATNNKLKQQNEKFIQREDQKGKFMQKMVHKLVNILPSNQRISKSQLTIDDIIVKISNYNKSLVTKFQDSQRNIFNMSKKNTDLEATISTLMEYKEALQNERDTNNQKLVEFQKLRQRLEQVTTLLTNKEEQIQIKLENIKNLQQEQQQIKLQHKQEIDALQQNVSTYPQQIQDLKKENKFLIDQLYFLKQNESKKSPSEIQSDSTQRDQLVNQYNLKFENLEKLMMQKQKKIQHCQNELHALINQIKEMREYNNLMSETIQSVKEQILSLVNQNVSDFSSHIQCLEETIKQQTESHNNLMMENDKLLVENTQLTTKISENQESMTKKVSQLKKELKIERDNVQMLSQEVKRKEMQLQILQMNKQMAQQQNEIQMLKNLQEEIAQLKRNNQDLRENLTQAQDKLKQNQETINKLQTQIVVNQEKYNIRLKEGQEKNGKISQTSPKKVANEANLREILRKEIAEEFQQQLILLKERFNQSYISMLREQGYFEGIKQITPFSMLYVDRLFQGNIFHDKIHYKFRVLQHLSTLNNCIVKETKLMYKLDPRNNTNFHAYIDNTPDMLFVVMTKTGTVIAGYYSGVYQNAVMNAPGLLISVTKNDSFTLKPNNRAMVYDPYFIIFGNAEFRVRSGESSVFCNFGIMNSYYDHRNKKVGDFLCAQNLREVDIDYFEIFQIIYEA